MNDQTFEKLLNIRTSGEQKEYYESLHYNRYEPTSYYALEALSKEYDFKSDDRVIDFGCGKGRLNFYLNYFFDCYVTGIEMNKFFYQEALDNKKEYLKEHNRNCKKTNFLNCYAENYEVNPKDNKFYFFNPFSMQIFMKVILNILISVEEYNREVEIILYYPSQDYIYYLENFTPFTLKKEVKLHGLYALDVRERFSIYQFKLL
ncbi:MULTISPECIES: methyltransferase [Clostridium]|uniref:Methyltransferase n=1 Tax=Clostridium senegalense TaxID=1465809 RepID=A0A6M0H2M1_9CLOT|nr:MULTISPECIES: methyltransferase [Clostridium]NEU04468.1 methyltransferase [Clostridium senegalense]